LSTYFSYIRRGQGKSKNADNLFADKQELIKDNDEGKREFAHSTSLCLATSCPETNYVTSARESETSKLKPDGRMMSEGQLRAKVCEDNRLTPEQHEVLYKVLTKYRKQLTKRRENSRNLHTVLK